MTDKRFDNWEEVDCNECARSWDSSCDGSKKDSKRLCNSFMATRSVILPEQLKALQSEIKRVYFAIVCIALSLIIHYLTTMFGG